MTPYLARLQSLYEPTEPTPKRLSNSNMQPIRHDILKLLVERLNSQLEDNGFKWMIPEDYTLLAEDSALGYEPLQPQAFSTNA